MTIAPATQLLTSYGSVTPSYNVADGEQRMWGAVILRAIVDAVWVDPEPTGRLSDKVNFNGIMMRRAANRLRDEAVFWLTLDNHGFNRICDLAGVQPSVVRKAFLHATDEDKARWAAADLSMHDLRSAGQLRG